MKNLESFLRIAYVLQNFNLDLSKEFGETIHVKYTLQGLQKAGHAVSYLALNGRSVIGINDISEPERQWSVPLRVTKTREFRFLESGTRRLQRQLRLPYFAFFDSYRFYEACCGCLPRYDLCHEHSALLSPAAAMACSRLGIPYVLTVPGDPFIEAGLRGQPIRSLQALIAKWGFRYSLKAADRVICVSAPLKQHLVDAWQLEPSKIRVLSNGVEINRFRQPYDTQAIRAHFGLHKEPVVMFIGSFQPWHGIDLLVEIFAQVLQDCPVAKLLLVGDGPSRQSVEQKVLDLDIANAVIITGLIPHVQIPEMLAIADVVTLPYPSLCKDLWFSPLKLFEYMAAGKAIVASKAGQIAEIIQHGHNGLLVESGNVESFARAVFTILQDSAEGRRLGENAREQAVQQYSWEKYVKELEAIYFSVL